MELNLSIILLILLVSYLISVWYRFFYSTEKRVKALLAQGLRLANFKVDPNDDYGGLKKAVQSDPDLKATVRKLPGKAFVSFIHPDLVKQVLNNPEDYAKLNTSSELTKLLSARSLIMTDGPRWKLHRLLVSEAFQYSFFKDMMSTVIQATDEIIGIYSKKEQTIHLPDTTELIASTIATRTFFGMESGLIKVNGHSAPEELTYIIMKTMSYNISPLRFFPGMWALNFFKDYRDVKKRIVNFRKVFAELMDKRMKQIKSESANQSAGQRKRQTDILEIFLQNRLKHNDDIEKTITNHEILDDFFMFSIAGKDTTSSLVSMSLYFSEKNPEWGAKLKEEVNRIIGKPEDINLDVINSLTFMPAFLNEVLRMTPPVPVIFPRIAVKDHYVGKIFIEKGTVINTSLIGSNFNPKYFDNPEEFNPARWLKSDRNREGWKDNSYACVPFSGGPRNCIGKHFALIEAKLMLSLILKNYEISLDPKFELKMGYVGIGYVPKELIPIKLTPK